MCLISPRKGAAKIEHYGQEFLIDNQSYQTTFSFVEISAKHLTSNQCEYVQVHVA